MKLLIIEVYVWVLESDQAHFLALQGLQHKQTVAVLYLPSWISWIFPKLSKTTRITKK